MASLFYLPGQCATTAAMALDAGRSSAAAAENAIPRCRATRASARRRSANVTGFVNTHSTFDAA